MAKSAFGSSVSKFNNIGVHPKLQNYNPSSKSSEIGPGHYNVIFNDNTSKNRFALQSWKRSYDLEKEKCLPHYLIREQKEIDAEKIKSMGPGYYEIDKSLDYITKHNTGTTVIQAKAARFFDIKKDCYPGPSTYGIPQEGLEHAMEQRKYSKSVGLLDRGQKSSISQSPSYHIGPGIYNIESGIDEFIKYRTGKRNIYDCNSIDRSAPLKTGHRSVMICHNLGPGQYNLESESNKNNDRYNHFKGKFLSEQQYPSKPYQRVFWSDPGNVPVDKLNQISPASYNVINNTLKPSTKIISKSAFGSSDVRMNKFALANFLGQNNTLIGPGRYNGDVVEMKERGNGCQSVFKSSVPKISDDNMVHTLRHRVRTLNIPIERKPKINHHSTEQSIRVDYVPQDFSKRSILLS